MRTFHRVVHRIPLVRPVLQHACLPIAVIFWTALLTTVSGCGQNPIDPETSSDSTLVRIVADLYLAEASVHFADSLQSQVAEGISVQVPSRSDVRDSILAVNGMTPDEFENAIQPYVDRPAELRRLYDRVLDRLSQARRPSRQQ